MKALFFLLSLCFFPLNGAEEKAVYLDYLKKDLTLLPSEKLNKLKHSKMSQLYSPEDRRFIDDRRERHLQLLIQLYRKKDFSLLLKGMKSFTQRFGQTKEEGLFYFFKISILENKIPSMEDISSQVQSYARRGIAQTGDGNLKEAFYKVLLREKIREKKQEGKVEKLSLLGKEIKKAGLDKLHSFFQQVFIEYALSLAKFESAEKIMKEAGFLPSVYRDDYELYIGIWEGRELSGFLHKTWSNYTESLLNNLIYLSLREGHEEKKAFFLHRFETFFNSDTDSYGFFAHYEDENFSSKNKKYNLVLKLKKLSQGKEVSLTKDETELLTGPLKLILWEKRLELLAREKKKSLFLAYLEAIPFYLLSEPEFKKITQGGTSYWKKLYMEMLEMGEYSKLLSHWENVSLKVSPSFFDSQLLVDIGLSYLLTGNTQSYMGVLKHLPKEAIYQLESYRHYFNGDWKKIVSMEKELKTHGVMALAYKGLGNAKKGKEFLEIFFINGEKEILPIREDLFLYYLQLIKSEKKAEGYRQVLLDFQEGKKEGSVRMPRVKEYVDFELIGLNMTLKTTSLEENLKKANIFLKNYPQSQFYSMMEITRAEILAQLKRIDKSTEAFKKIFTKTHDEKIKAKVLDEILVLRKEGL